ncbi:MAG TPA: metallopeptidase family protein, partial [Actinomycetota bacterium]|nr:metallopeptidase family protein [Actinomycetota bacterium]
ELASQMSNVQVVVEDLPDEETSGGHEEGGLLLGLYQGVPLTRRSSSNYFGVLPDRITIYRLNIERICASADEVPDAVRRTVIHEVAHHFGISDPRLDELGWG